jgi:hypothetical protein
MVYMILWIGEFIRVESWKQLDLTKVKENDRTNALGIIQSMDDVSIKNKPAHTLPPLASLAAPSTISTATHPDSQTSSTGYFAN